MTEKTVVEKTQVEALLEVLVDVFSGVRSSVEGLRLEVGGLRTHMGSSTHFLVMAVEDLQKLIDQSNAVMQAVRVAQAEQSKTVQK